MLSEPFQESNTYVRIIPHPFDMIGFEMRLFIRHVKIFHINLKENTLFLQKHE